MEMELQSKARQVSNPFLEHLRKQGRLHEPVAKRAKLSPSPSKADPTQNSKQQTFTANDLQKCLFSTSAVHPVNTQELIAKRRANTCFWCDASSANPNFQCPQHKHEKTASQQTSQFPLALRSLPPEVGLCTSSIPGAGYGICAKRTIPVGAWIGPYEGKCLKPEELSPFTDTSYMWEIFKDGKVEGFVDGSDEKVSSWMRFIRCARYKKEQNLFAFQYLGKVYYRSFKAILPGEEMLVWYDEKYPQYLGIPGIIFDMGAVAANGAKSQPEKSGTVLPNEKDCSSTKTTGEDAFPPTPPSSAPSPSSPASPNSQQHSPTKPVSGDPVNGLQSEVPSAFDFSSVVNYEISPQFPHSPPPLPSPPESIRSDTSSPSHSEDGHNDLAKTKKPVFTSVTELSLWKCGQCKKSFPQRTMLQVHVCNGAPKKPYQCGHCEQSFSHPAQLRAHAVSHASKKPFKCGYCSRAFAGATTLNNHIRTHTGEKPFVCDKCGKNFTQGSQLSRHQRIPGDCVVMA